MRGYGWDLWKNERLTRRGKQVLAVGFLLVILSSAIWHNFLPLIVVATYVVAPLPNWICSRCANPDDFIDSSGNSVADFGRFLTGFLVLMGVGELSTWIEWCYAAGPGLLDAVLPGWVANKSQLCRPFSRTRVLSKCLPWSCRLSAVCSSTGRSSAFPCSSRNKKSFNPVAGWCMGLVAWRDHGLDTQMLSVFVFLRFDNSDSTCI